MNALLRIAAWVLAVCLVVAPVFAVLNGWIGGSRWPMRHLVVTGEFRQVSDGRVRAVVLPLVQQGFFAVDLERLRVHLRKLPWVKSVEVRKRWPDRLEVTIVEYRPLARWGAQRMLSENGELFPAPKGLGARLPLFEGPDARAAEMISFHSSARPLFLGSGLQVSTVRLSARGSWSLRLSDGTEVEVGRSDSQHRLERFSRLLPRLRAQDPRPLTRADLRYTNGFALVWGPLHAPAPAGSTSSMQGTHESQG
jgi:cell division protein FtsQ